MNGPAIHPVDTTVLRASRRRSTSAYIIMLIAGAGVFLAIREAGSSLVAPHDAGAPPLQSLVGHGKVHVFAHVLMTLAAVVALGNILSRMLAYFDQPRVIGEVLAGIALGPSLLGAISPEAMYWLIPDKNTDPNGLVYNALRGIAQLGVVLYMFLIGLELNAAKLKHQAHAAIIVSHASIIAPFLMGAALSLWLYPILSHDVIPFLSFALFFGVAFSVTAFPVLASILKDRGLDKSEAGIVALGCAAADDVTAWCLLALVVGVAQNRVDNAFMIGLWSLIYITALLFIVRPLVTRLVRSWDHRPLSVNVIPTVLIGVLLSAWITEIIGIHAVFGAFLIGLIIPHDSRIARVLIERVQAPVTTLLLPAFFAAAGLRTELGSLNHWQDWLIVLIIIAVATLGKMGSTAISARIVGYPASIAFALGAMMNTRGLMGLIVLDIGLSMGIISHKVFTMMVIMALVCTLMTAPILRWCKLTRVESAPDPR